MLRFLSPAAPRTELARFQQPLVHLMSLAVVQNMAACPAHRESVPAVIPFERRTVGMPKPSPAQPDT